MKPKHIKKVLMSEINKVANNPKDYCFILIRTYPKTENFYESNVNRNYRYGSGSLTNELIDFFSRFPSNAHTICFFTAEK